MDTKSIDARVTSDCRDTRHPPAGLKAPEEARHAPSFPANRPAPGQQVQSPIRDLYESDFQAWTVEQGRLLRACDIHLADLDNIAEEIEALGRSERAALKSAYRLVALHLLKLIVQKQRKSRSWLATMACERNKAAGILTDNPGLTPKRGDLFLDPYRDARKEASAETGLPLVAFPAEPPFRLDEAEDKAFLTAT